MKIPKVSICIPAYKQVDYLQRTLESAQRQTFDDYEIILTDDSSDDSVKNLVEKFDFHDKLMYYKNPKTLGSPENWNEAIRRANGKYIKILHHDDWFADENSLEEFVKMLDENPIADFAFSSSKNFDQHNKLKSIHIPTQTQLNMLHEKPDLLFFGNFIGAPSATIYRKTGNLKFDINLKWLVDIDFYIRALDAKKEFIFSQKPLICISTQNPAQITSYCQNNKDIEVREYIYLYQKLSKRSEKRRIYFLFFWNLLRRFGITSKNDIIECNTIGPVPQLINIVLIAGKIYNIFPLLKYFRLLSVIKSKDK